MAEAQVAPNQQQAPDTLPADFFQTKGTATATVAPDTLPADFKFKETQAKPESQPSAWQVLTQPTEKTDKEYLGYKGPAGVAGATVHGLNKVAEETKNAVGGIWNQAKDIVQNPDRPLVIPDKEGKYKGQPTIVDQLNPWKGLGQVAQVPRAIRDINASPDPLGYYAEAAEDTAAQGAGQALTAIGTEKAGEEIVKPISKKLIAKAQAARPEAVAHTALEARAVESEKALATARAEMDKYSASLKEGVQPPADVVKKYEKAAANAREDRYHAETAKRAAYPAATSPTAKPAPQPEVPAEQIEAMPQPGAKKPALPKVAERPTVSPAHATTTVPQEPIGRPQMPTGQMRLPGGEPVGKPKLLTEGTPEGPKVPEGGLPKLAPTPEPAKPVVTDEAALRALEAKEGKVVTNPKKLVGEQLKEALKPGEAPKAKEEPAYEGEERREAPRPATMSPTEIENAMKNRKPVHTPFDVTEGAMETIKRDEAMPKHPAEEAAAKPVLPKEEPTGYAAKKEELVPAGAEGREPVKSAAEYHPAVQEQVTALPDEKLRQLAKAHGLNPDEYDFKARDEHRHRVERDQLAAEITAQMGDDEKINIGRNAEKLEHNPDMASKTKAQRAESLFPRLRGPVDEFGNPTVRGGAPETVGTEKAAKSDTEHFANAKKELGDKASISDVAKRAQELKDTHTQLAAHEANGGSTFSSKGKDLNGTDNYSVGSYPDRTEQVDKLTPERLEEFKKKNDDVLSKEGHAVGTWKDPDTGKAVLDVARIYTDRDEAIAAGKAANQKSIYHLGGEGEIKTGGTGEGPVAGTKAKPDFDMIKDADGKPDRLEITHNGEPMGHLKIEEQVPGTWTIKDAAVKPGEQGKGFGKAAFMQAFDEALKAGAKTVESDVSNTSKANATWESIKKDYPEAVTEENGQYSVDLGKYSEGNNPMKRLGQKKKPGLKKM